jgi:hypothetical protein
MLVLTSNLSASKPPVVLYNIVGIIKLNKKIKIWKKKKNLKFLLKYFTRWQLHLRCDLNCLIEIHLFSLWQRSKTLFCSICQKKIEICDMKLLEHSFKFVFFKASFKFVLNLCYSIVLLNLSNLFHLIILFDCSKLLLLKLS